MGGAHRQRTFIGTDIPSSQYRSQKGLVIKSSRRGEQWHILWKHFRRGRPFLALPMACLVKDMIVWSIPMVWLTSPSQSSILIF